MMPINLGDSKFKKFLVIAFIIHGLFGFMCFVIEESMQTAMFGAFAYNNAKDCEGLRWHVKNVMEPTHKVGSALIKGFGWLAPVTYPAYLMYIKTNAGYIRSVKRKCSQ